ncbi:MAG TPA: DUF4231 domain-containing protein [Nitrosomonas mobilis]|nr:DUF4231 domain-containing protein [Nitrosomonas mobilis]
MTADKDKHWSHQKLRSYSSMTPEEYIDERLNQFREWYDKKAVIAKRNYQWMRAITVVGGAIVPVLVNLPLDDHAIRYLTTIVSLIVVILISLESVFHFREQWKNYRSTEQLLAKEYFNFVTGEGPYRNQDEKEAFLNFVDRVENAVASENASTLNVMTTLSEKKVEAAVEPGKKG